MASQQKQPSRPPLGQSKCAPFRPHWLKKGFLRNPNQPTKYSDRPIRDPRNGPILRSSDPQKSPDQVRVEFVEMDGCEKYSKMD